MSVRAHVSLDISLALLGVEVVAGHELLCSSNPLVVVSLGRSSLTSKDPHVLHVVALVDDGVGVVVSLEDQVVGGISESLSEELNVTVTITSGALGETVDTESLVEGLVGGLGGVVHIELTSGGVKVGVLSLTASPGVGLEWLVESVTLLIPVTLEADSIKGSLNGEWILSLAVEFLGESGGNDSGSNEGLHLAVCYFCCLINY